MFSPATCPTRLQGDLTYRLGASHTLRGGFYFGEYGVESDQTSQVFPIVVGQPAITPISRRPPT